MVWGHNEGQGKAPNVLLSLRGVGVTLKRVSGTEDIVQ